MTVLLCLMMVPGASWGRWNGRCVTTEDLAELNPQYAATPLVMFWKAKIKKEIVLVTVRIPETQEVLFSFIQCAKAEIREDRPEPDEAQLDCMNTERLGDFWMPLADIEESASESAPEFDLEHPTEFFASRISFHLEEYASSMKWDPIISSAISSIDQLFLGLVGLSVWYQSTHVYKPTKLRQRIFRRGMQGLGIVLMVRQGILAATSARSQFVEERNQRAAHIENLIQQINERMTMRIDGQDQGQNLEEADGYSALVNSIVRANNDAYEEFCNN